MGSLRVGQEVSCNHQLGHLHRGERVINLPTRGTIIFSTHDALHFLPLSTDLFKSRGVKETDTLGLDDNTWETDHPLSRHERPVDPICNGFQCRLNGRPTNRVKKKCLEHSQRCVYAYACCRLLAVYYSSASFAIRTRRRLCHRLRLPTLGVVLQILAKGCPKN